MRLKGKKPIFNYDDTYSLDATLSPIIAEGLKKFKQVVMDCEFCGYPAVFELSQESKDALDMDDDYYDNVSKDIWLSTLDKMIYAFDSKEPEVPDGLLEHETLPSDKEGLSEMKIHVTDEKAYNAHKLACKIHEGKCEEGREIFAKYYNSLWW